ncbi:hypothetical protein ACP70R_033664 [Stipagrostis hirtigluma subsp. patula]
MELRKRPRPRLLDPGFVSSPPLELLRKRARKQEPAAKRPRDAAEAARCAGRSVGSLALRLHPVMCIRQAAPLPPRPSRRVSYIRPRHPFNWE